ncbi:nucleotide disphospho-sugar-binding domain-containing protein, partial [Streptomyces sp. NPDC003077]|uniref:nucleotide disphospho-sugar-binding domain-containing protein n=1 Tax=Streptomyces sp. NPDC003077 TaxID=3154443 RepID=UPI0033B90B96
GAGSGGHRGERQGPRSGGAVTGMRVLFVASGWPTHYMAMVPLAWALRAAGHDVRVAAQPSMHPVIVRSGMPAVGVGPDVDFASIRRRTLPHERQGTDRPRTAEELRAAAERDDGGLFRAWNEATTAALDDTVAFARAFRPELVVGDTMAPAALVAAHALGVVGVRHLWGPDILGSPGGERVLDVLPGYWEQFERHGVRPSGDPAHRTVSPCPPSLRLPAAPGLLPLRWVPYNGTGPVPAWLREPPRGPRVCVTWGTSTTDVVGRGSLAVPDVLDALAGMDVEVVVAVTAAERETIGTPPPGVRVLENTPLHLLLPGASLLIHQGGFMTALSAAYHGVPQLVVPQLPNQISDAEVLERTGAARRLPVERAGRERLREAVEAVLGVPSYADAAGRVREEILALPAPREVARTLRDLAGAGV